MINLKHIKLLLLLGLAPLAASADNSVGTPVAAVDVDRNGAATYNLSVEIPDGGGFHPQIGLAYNSQSAGYGNAGYGFNITGISVITSGSRNLYYDGKVKGAEYLANSSYYLDGKRLVLESGTEGCDGAKYSVEGDPYTMVSVHGSYPNIWFEVLGQDGTTYKYGSSTSSRLSFKKYNTPCCAAWYIDTAIDKYKNLISYGYTKFSLCILPTSITYGVNLAKSRNMSCTIIFTYDDIAYDNQIDFYVGGNRGTIYKKLSTITSYMNSKDYVYRKYTLTYDEGLDNSTKKYSRLTRITESNGKGETYAPVVIDWNRLPSYSISSKPIRVETVLPNSDYFVEDSKVFIAADMNNDGVTDIIRLAPGKFYQYKYEYESKYSSGSGSSYTPITYLSISLSKVDLDGNVTFQEPIKMDLKPFIKGYERYYGFRYYSSGISAADFNGDGYSDLMIPYYKEETGNRNGTQYIPSYCIIYGGEKPSRGPIIEEDQLTDRLKRFYDCNPICTMLDMSGNGKTELISLETSEQNGYYNANIIIYGDPNWKYESVKLSLANKPEKIFTGDYNNDGLSDLIVIYKDGYKIFYNNGYTFGYASVFNNTNVYTIGTTSNSNYLRDCYEICQGDFNGDGLIDFVSSKTDDGKLYLALNNGNGTFTYKVTTSDFDLYNQGETSKDNDDMSINVIDLDHDGRSDVVIAKSMFKEMYQLWPLPNYYKYDEGKGTTYIKWLKSTGEDLKLYATYSKKNREKDASPGHIFIGDFDGDGAAELANYGAQLNRSTNIFYEDTIYTYKCGTNIPSLGKVSAITDGFGVKTSFKYSSATNPTVCEIGTEHNEIINSYAIPLSVVSQMTTSAQGVSTNTTKFQYGDMRVHSLGRGSLGFKSFTKKNVNTGVTENTIIDWSINNLTPKRITKTITMSDGSKSTTIQRYACYRFATVIDGTEKFYKYFAYPSLCTVTDCDDYVTTTSWKYDTSKGVMTSQKVTNDNDKFYKETVYIYSSNKICNMWLPIQIKTTQKHSDDSKAYSITTQYTYDKVYGNPSTIVTIPNSNSALALTTTYTYDSYGNKLSEITSSDKDTNVKKIQTLYEYNSMGNRFVTGKKTSPASTSLVYEYNMFGDLIKEKDNTVSTNILETSHTPNGWNEITKTTYPDGNYVEYSKVWEPSYGTGYYSITETPNNGPWTKIVYDPLGREVSTSSVGLKGVAISKETTYNSKGQVSSVVNKKGNLTLSETYTYDTRGRKKKDVSSTGASTTYSYDKRTVTTTSAGRTKTAKCDAWGNMLETTDPLGTTVTYTYNSNGQPSRVTTNGSEVTFKYDDAGRCIEMNDPDAGTMTYSYAADGTLLSQTDARGVTTNYSYDDLKRLTTKTYVDKSGNKKTQTNKYFTGGKDINRLESQTYDGYKRSFMYDNYGRVISETRNMGIGSSHCKDKRTSYTTEWKYNSLGQKESVSYPSFAKNAMTFNYSYDEYGYLSEIKHNDESLYSVKSYNGLTLETNTVAGILSKTVDKDGYPSVCQLSGKDSQTFSYDKKTGNLLSRFWKHGVTTMLNDSMRYDKMDRLVSVIDKETNKKTMTMTYAQNGNILSKTGIGTYTYDNSKIHAVTSVSNSSKIITSNAVGTEFALNGKISTIGCDGAYRAYYYGPDDEKWATYGWGPTQPGEKDVEHLYFGDYEEITEDDGGFTEYCFLENGIIISRRTFSNTNGCSIGRYQAVTDNLGSILAVYDQFKQEKFCAKYDAWGKQTVYTNKINFQYGYTGHEMLPDFDLIDMGARLYDPNLGRFLSCDNYVQAPDNSQNFNRYSYCLNNPLKYTDPSGNLYGIDDFVIASAIFAAGSSALMASATDQNVWTAVGKSLITSAVCYGASYLASCATTAIGTGLGHEIGSLGTELTRGAAHGIVQGMSSVVTGGSFESGFATGFVSSLVGSGSQALGFGANTTLGSMSIAGGLASVLTGGDFIDGMTTGYGIGALNHTWTQSGGNYSISYSDEEDPRYTATGTLQEMVCTPKGTFAKALDYATGLNSKYGAAGSISAYKLGKFISKIKPYVTEDMKGNILNSANPTVKIGPFYPSYKSTAAVSKAAKFAGKSSSIATIGIDLVDCIYYGELKPSYVVDGIILGVGVACPLGWVAGVGYVGLDMIHQHFCDGQSIADHINSSIGTIKWR